jgi:hypothetical protein
MSTDLDNFVRLFPHEHDLQLALVDLVSKIPGTTRVQLLQGKLEHGKDIVFRRELLPGRPVLIACVVKNHAITGTAYEGSKSTATVMNQVRQALKNPFRDTDGTLAPVHMVYVITPYDVSREAILSVEGELIELCGRFEFLCGSALLDLFKKYYPTFITFKGDFFNSYLQGLISNLESQSPLSALAKTAAILSAIYETFVNTYVEPRFAAYFGASRPKPSFGRMFPFGRRISRIELEESVKLLYRVSALLFNSECWVAHVSSAGWPRLGLSLSRIAQELPRWWDLEASQYISKAQVGGVVGAIDRSTIEVLISESWAAPYDLPRVRKAAEDCIQDFGSLMRRADEAWSGIHRECSSFLDLFSFPLLNYAQRAQELTARCPSLFEGGSEFTQISASQSDLTSQYKSFAVTAPPGYGKTTFCKWNAINDARSLLETAGSIFPVYVPLHRYNETEATDIAFLSPELHEFLCSQQAQSHGLSLVRIYLDGLDELRSRHKKNAVLDLAKDALAIKFPVQFIITSRDSSFNARMATHPRFHIKPLDTDEAQLLVRKLLRDNLDQIKEFWTQVHGSGNLSELLKVPLLLQLIASVFQKTAEIPQNRYRLYQMFLELLAHGWDRAKSVERGFVYESEINLKVLQILAGRLHSQGRRDASLDELSACAEGITGAGNIDVAILANELLHQGLIVQSGNSYLFAHLSFQEYLAARDLNDPSGLRQGSALMRFLNGDDWWREVISFYINGHSSPSDLELWARGGIQRNLRRAPNGKRAQLGERIELLKGMFASSHPGFNVRLPSHLDQGWD